MAIPMTTDETESVEPARAVEALAETISEHAAESERLGRIAPPVQDALLKAGLFRMLLPRAHGGLETPPPAFARAIEAAAKIDASTAWCLCQGNGCAMAAAYVAPEVAKTMFGDDPRAVLAWGPGKAEAHVVEGGYRVTARIAFASGGRHATWLGCHVPVFEADGSRRMAPDGAPELRTMLFPASAVRWIDTWDVIGLRATGSDDFEIDDLFVPEAYTALRDVDRGRHHATTLYAMPSMSMYAMGFSMTAQGIARAMLEAFMDLATDKTPRMAKSKMMDNPVIQNDVALCEARLKAARAYLFDEVEDIWAEVLETGALSVANRIRIRLAATHGIHEAKAVAETVYDLSGVSAIRAESPFQRRYRDIRSVTQQLQGRRSHYQTVGAYMFGHPADLGVA
jgi:alkylation response protein AidB-like acyl-CoA dehydrogenase